MGKYIFQMEESLCRFDSGIDLLILMLLFKGKTYFEMKSNSSLRVNIALMKY